MEQGGGNSSPVCPLPYPDRFNAAITYVARVPESTFNNETRLLFYALHKQATAGPCKEAKPWSWNVVESAKWQSWSQLADMSSMDAMRLYVKTLDEEQPEWWTRLPSEPAPGSPDAAAAAADGGPAESGVSISHVFQEGTWVVIQQDDAKKPLPRYEQGAALMGPNLYIMGGHYSGRYLADLWMYNLNKLAWTAPTPAEPEAAEATGQEGSALLAASGPPPAAGWSVTPLQDNKLLVMGGHTKAGKPKKGQKLPPLPVWVVDLDNMSWTSLVTTGDIPTARGGHSASPLPDDKIVIYGGEDGHRRPMAEAYVLDLQEFTWSKLQITSKQQPTARSGHAAALVNNLLVVFGGGSVANCFSDLWVLDLTHGSWSKPEVVGPSPTPRAGHGGVLVGDSWYILGGGNNVKGCTEMLVADLSDLGANRVSWTKVCNVPAGSPLSSEGISLLHCPEYNMLVAFGGYNGKYHNAVSVYKLPNQAPQASQQAGEQQQASQPAQQPPQQEPKPQQLQPQQDSDQQPGPTSAQDAAAAAKRSATANGGPPMSNGNQLTAHEQKLLKDLALSREQLKRDLAATKQELELVAGASDAAKEEAAAQINLLSQQLSAAQQRLGEAEKGAEEARSALSAEQAKTLKLETQVAELTDKLGSVQELEKELSKYRMQEAEQTKKKASSGSLWSYMAGSS